MHEARIKHYKKLLEEAFEEKINPKKDLLLALSISLVSHGLLFYYLHTLAILNFGSIDALRNARLQLKNGHDIVIILNKSGKHQVK